MREGKGSKCPSPPAVCPTPPDATVVYAGTFVWAAEEASLEGGGTCL